MATQISICSNAFLKLGAGTISDLSDGTDRATLASNLFPTVRDSTLRAHTWNCATSRAILAPEVNKPAFGFANKFLLPSDCLRVIQVGEDDDDISYKVEGRYILADVTVLPLRYIWRNTNVGTWDEMLIYAMTLAMTAEMCYPITESTTLMAAHKQELREYLKYARSVDGQEDPPETLGDFPLINARFGGV